MLKNGKLISFEQSADFYFRRGDSYAEKKEYLMALNMYWTGAEKRPKFYEGWQKISGLYAQLGRFDLSNRVLLNCLWHCDEVPPDMNYDLGSNFIGLHEYEWAMAFFERYAQESQDKAAAQKVDILKAIGQMQPEDGADEGYALDDELELKQLSYVIEMQAQQLIKRGKLSTAKELLLQSSEILPNALKLPEILTEVYLKMGCLQECRELAKSILIQDGGNIAAHCALLHIKRKENPKSRGIRSSLKALKNCVPGSGKEAYAAAVALDSYGLHREAKSFFEKALKEDPCNTAFMHGAAVNCYYAGSFDEAEALWRDLASILRGDPVAAYYAALVQEERGEPIKLPYEFDLPDQEKVLALSRIRRAGNESDLELLERDERLYRSILWAIYYGEENLKPLMIELMARYFVFEAPDVLRDFLLQPDQHLENKQKAADELSRIGVCQPYYTLMDSGLAEVFDDSQEDLYLTSDWSGDEF